MKTCILFIAAFIAFAIPAAYAEKGAYLDGVDFVQYLDENTALEEPVDCRWKFRYVLF